MFFSPLIETWVRNKTCRRSTFAVISLRAVSNDMDDLRPLVPAVVAALNHARPGTVVVVGP